MLCENENMFGNFPSAVLIHAILNYFLKSVLETLMPFSDDFEESQDTMQD
jgi:hypothetical protein